MSMKKHASGAAWATPECRLFDAKITLQPSWFARMGSFVAVHNVRDNAQLRNCLHELHIHPKHDSARAGSCKFKRTATAAG